MISVHDYALLAGAAYSSTRTLANQIREPRDWMPYLTSPMRVGLEAMGFQVVDGAILGPSGFEARVLQKGSETVISYAGTLPSNWRGDQVTNASLGLGLYTDTTRQPRASRSPTVN